MSEINFYAKKYNTPIGPCLIVAKEDKLIGLWFEGQKYDCPIKDKLIWKENEVLEQTAKWLDLYFAGKKPEISELPLEPEGSSFRQEVWKILCQIPYGSTVTYGEIADIVGKKYEKEKMSAQAVGGAVAHNPISIIIPCHRVVGADGSLTGYAGGISKKRWLLEHEKVNLCNKKTKIVEK